MNPLVDNSVSPASRAIFIFWLIALTMVPNWVGLHNHIYLPIQSAVAIVVIVAYGTKGAFKPAWPDVYLLAFFAVALIIVAVGYGRPGQLTETAVCWILPYFAARIAIPAIGTRFASDSIAIFLTLVASLAIIEFSLDWHPYVAVMTSAPEYATWGPIQVRAGVARSEWAFGHSIALGGSLALAIAFIFMTKFRMHQKVVMVAIVIVAIWTTQSRAAMIAAVTTLLLCLVYNLVRRGATVAVVATIVLSLSAAQFLPTQITEFAFGTTAETQESAAYRGRLYDTLIPALQFFGRSDYLHISRFKSIDSELLLIGAYFGWFLMLMMLLPFAVIAVRLVTGRAFMVEAGILGQLPLLTTAVTIQLYQYFLFIAFGFAVCLATNMRLSEDNENVPGDVDDNGNGRSTPSTLR